MMCDDLRAMIIIDKKLYRHLSSESDVRIKRGNMSSTFLINLLILEYIDFSESRYLKKKKYKMYYTCNIKVIWLKV